MTPSSDTRERIVLAARHLFCRRGYSAVGTQDLCERAEINKGSLYYFFPSKLDIALAALQHFGRTAGSCFATIIAEQPTVTDRIRGLFQLERDEAMEQQAESGHVHGCLLANLSQELTGSVIEIQLCVESIYADWAAILAKIFAGDKNAKALPPERQLEFANVVLSYMNGAILMAKVKNDPQQIVTLGEQFLPYFVKSERTKKKRTKANVYAQ